MKYSIYSFLLLFVFTFISCSDDFFDQVVEIDIPEHESKLVMNMKVDDDNLGLNLGLTNSVGALTNDLPQYQSGIVTLSRDGVQEVVFAPIANTSLEDPNYGGFLNSPPVPGETFTLTATSSTLGTVTSTQVVPAPVTLNSVTFENDAGVSIDGFDVDELKIQFDDPLGVENYYEVEFRLIDTVGNWSDRMYVWNDIDPILVRGARNYVISDLTFDGQTDVTFRFNSDEYALDNPSPGEGYKIKTTLKSITKEEYLYQQSFRALRDFDGNPFAEPVVLYSNVEGGYGAFLMRTSTSTFITPEL